MSDSDQEFTITLEGRDYQIEMYGNSVLVNGVPFIAGFEGDGVTIDGILHQVVLLGDTVKVDGETYSVAFEGLGPLSATGSTPTRPAATELAAAAEGTDAHVTAGRGSVTPRGASGFPGNGQGENRSTSCAIRPAAWRVRS